MKRPTFFLSSTIYDFRDLRSAVKFYLEENGCRVLASEYNDFNKSLDLHSYEACLQAIHSADYFLLFIGSRVGGWFDETQRISITQREYREAHRLQLEGRLKLMNFVRSEVWQYRESYRELEKVLQTLNLDDSTKSAITNRPSRFANDAEFLCSFINEVTRSRETKLAVAGQSIAPTGNWVHVFTEFREIVAVLNSQIFSAEPVDDALARRLLLGEVREFIRRCLVKSSEGICYSPRQAINRFHQINKNRKG